MKKRVGKRPATRRSGRVSFSWLPNSPGVDTWSPLFSAYHHYFSGGRRAISPGAYQTNPREETHHREPDVDLSRSCLIICPWTMLLRLVVKATSMVIIVNAALTERDRWAEQSRPLIFWICLANLEPPYPIIPDAQRLPGQFGLVIKSSSKPRILGSTAFTLC